MEIIWGNVKWAQNFCKKKTLRELLVLIQEYERVISSGPKKSIGHEGSNPYLIDSATFMLNFVLTTLELQ